MLYFHVLSFLDVSTPLIVGSLPSEFNYNYPPISGSLPGGFTGCMRNVAINGGGAYLDFSRTLLERELSAGCDHTDENCDSSPCQNEGQCVGSWSDHSCLCKPPYYGTTCSLGEGCMPPLMVFSYVNLFGVFISITYTWHSVVRVEKTRPSKRRDAHCQPGVVSN